MLNPFIREATPSIVTVGGKMCRRVIFDYELIYVERGHFTYFYDGTDYECDKGKVLLVRPGISHAFSRVTEELSQPHIHFDPVFSGKSEAVSINFTDFPNLTEKDRSRIETDIFADYPQKPFLTLSDMPGFLSAFYGVIDAYGRKRYLSAKGLMLQILDMIIAENFPKSVAHGAENAVRISKQIKSYIDSGQGINMTLEDFEKRFSYSRFYLEREFKAEYGISIIAYRNERVLNSAAELLRDHSISGIAEALGFSSIYAFSRAFRTRFGVSPTEYRKQMMKV